MSLPKSLVQPLRQGQLVVGAGMRAYFAPFNQAFAVTQLDSSKGATIFDMIVTGKFVDGASGPPAGWVDLGYIRNFRFTPQGKIGSVVAGYRGVIKAKYRAEIGDKFGFIFGEYTHMAVRIAAGTQVFNLVDSTASASTVGPLSSSGTPALAMGASGYVAAGAVAGYVGEPTLYVPAGSGSFAVGQYIVCDQDYNGTDFGYVGDAGVNVFQGAVSATEVDFIRKTSDYVACIKAVVSGAAPGQDALILTKKFVGGGNNPNALTANTAPTAGAKIQKIHGYATRQGGTTISEWSAIFLLDTIDASQIIFYYPRVSPDVYGGLPGTNLQNATSMQTYELECSFDALAFDDPIDGETVTSYQAYLPKPNLDIQV